MAHYVYEAQAHWGDEAQPSASQKLAQKFFDILAGNSDFYVYCKASLIAAGLFKWEAGGMGEQAK